MKKTISVLLAILLILSALSACGAEDESGQNISSKRTDLTVAVDEYPVSLNPFKTGYIGIFTLTHQPLFISDGENELIPVIAQSYEQTDENSFSVKIKENICDSDGNEILADDVLSSYYMMCISSGSLYFSQFDTQKPFEKIGDYEVIFHMADTFPLQRFITAMTTIPIVSYLSLEEENERPAGTGPYKIINASEGKKVVLAKNLKYWWEEPCEEFSQNFEKITFSVMADKDEQVTALQNGKIDFIANLTPEQSALIETDSGIERELYPTYSYLNICFNCLEGSPFENRKLRQAVCYALDKNAASMSLKEHFYMPALSIANPSSYEWRAEFATRELYKCNQDKARQLVAELKDDGKTTSFSILVSADDGDMVRMADLIAGACTEVGMTVKIITAPADQFNAIYSSNVPWNCYLVSYSPSYYYLSASLRTQISRVHYPDDSELSALLTEASATFDKDICAAAIDLWEEELPFIPLLWYRNAVAYSGELKNVGFNNYHAQSSIYFAAISR